MTLWEFEQTAPDKVKIVFGFENQILHKYLRGWFGLRGGGIYSETWKLEDKASHIGAPT